MLYELLSERRPFTGQSDLEILQAIQHQAPGPLPETLPVLLRTAVEKALEKDPAERYQSMRELVVDLRRAARQRTVGAAAAPAVKAAPARVGRWGWLAAALIGTAALAWWAGAGWRARQPASAGNPLANAQFTRLTDFEGAETEAVISPDGRFAAFLSDRNGRFDIWMNQIGSGQFVNLTQTLTYVPDFRLPVQSLGFTPDGSSIWLGGVRGHGRFMVMPLTGGSPRPLFGDRVVAAAWSQDGAQLVYHTYDDGDPTFVADRNGSGSRKIHADEPGMHSHFPIWSLDGKWIYFVRGLWATFEMDIWRIGAEGGEPQQLTRLNADIRYPVPIDANTMLYVAPASDGSGPWLWALDIARRSSQRVGFGLEKYTSISATSNGRRLVATVANPTANLWSIPILDRTAEEKDAIPFPVPTVRALAPRFAGDTLYYLSSAGSGDGLWRSQSGQALEIWKGAEVPLLEAPAVAPDGRRIAIVLRREHAGCGFIWCPRTAPSCSPSPEH